MLIFLSKRLVTLGFGLLIVVSSYVGAKASPRMVSYVELGTSSGCQGYGKVTGHSRH